MGVEIYEWDERRKDMGRGPRYRRLRSGCDMVVEHPIKHSKMRKDV